MTRPTDWAPLAAEDPVPGDPTVVRAHARHLAEMADDIAAQVSRLQRIASADGLVGEFVEPLKQGASQLAERLGRVQGRYEQVAAALGAYAPELEAAQEESLRIRQRAQVAEGDRASYQRQVEAFPVASLDGRWQSTIVADSGAGHEYRLQIERQRDQAEADLARERSALRRVEDARDRAAAAAARRIEQGVDDSVVDSWWDSVKEWVHHQAGWLREVSRDLGYLGVVLMVATLFVPGLEWVGTAALWAGWGALAFHTPLALSGEGSWLDVGLDVVGLVTLGAGKLVMPALTRSAAALRQVGAFEKGTQAAAAAAAKGGRLRALLRLASRIPVPGAGLADQALDSLTRMAGARATKAFVAARDDFLGTPLPRVAWHEVITLGGSDGELAILAKDARTVMAEFPGSTAIAQIGREFARLHLRAAGAFGTSAATGWWGAIADTFKIPAWNHLGSHWTREVGSTW